MKTAIYVSVAQMRRADRRCIEELGIPGAVLMNNAGTAVFHEVAAEPVGVVCGTGNNGGDGFVVARLALLAGLQTRVVLVGEREKVTGDSRTFMEAYRRLGGHIVEAHDEAAAAEAVRQLGDCGTVVDALLGTGLSGEVRGRSRAAIDHWPPAPTVAVDVPSGLNADTGEVLGAAVRAQATVTFQFPKSGFRVAAAQPYIGHLVVADIGIPAVCADDEAWRTLRGD